MLYDTKNCSGHYITKQCRRKDFIEKSYLIHGTLLFPANWGSLRLAWISDQMAWVRILSIKPYFVFAHWKWNRIVRCGWIELNCIDLYGI